MRRALVVALGTTGFLIGSCVPALAVTVPKPRTKPFSEVEAGVMLSSTGLRFEDVYRIKRSPDGEGAAVRDGLFGGTAFPVTGTDTVTSNYKDGRQTAIGDLHSRRPPPGRDRRDHRARQVHGRNQPTPAGEVLVHVPRNL